MMLSGAEHLGYAHPGASLAFSRLLQNRFTSSVPLPSILGTSHGRIKSSLFNNNSDSRASTQAKHYLRARTRPSFPPRRRRLTHLACAESNNFTDTFREAGVELVDSLEEAENQSLKAASHSEDPAPQNGQSPKAASAVEPEGNAENSPGGASEREAPKVLAPGTSVSSVSEALETIWTEGPEKRGDSTTAAEAPKALDPECLMAAAAKVSEALEQESRHVPGQVYFHMLEPVSPVAAPVMVRDFSETVDSSDSEDERDEDPVIGFKLRTEASKFAPPAARPEPATSDAEKSSAFLAPSDILLPDDDLLLESEDAALLQPGAVAGAVLVREVAEALKGDAARDGESRDEFLGAMGGSEKYQRDSGGGGDEAARAEKSLVEQLREIIVFAGPALGIWLSGPIMGIIDTAVIGNSSSLELAALGPGTVLCDQVCYIFMFLSVATSNLIATSLAQKNREEAEHHLSRMLFLAVACGMGLLIVTEVWVTQLLQAFVGAQNYALIPAARVYVQIRALAWPAVLVSLVAQSASLGMMDSKTPLKVLMIGSTFNLVGDVVLCSFMGYGIAGAAWATIASQYVAGILMALSLNSKGYNALNIQAPSVRELVDIAKLTAPLLLSMISKVAFYTLVTYLATSLGAVTIAAHQVMVGIYGLCAVWGEPLAQTAQSFMPPLMYGTQRNLKQARKLLNQLMTIGVVVGTLVGAVAVAIPWVCPQVFTKDPAIISQMRGITIPFIVSTISCPPTLSLEGTLLAGRDFKFLSFSMTTCFIGGTIMLLACRTLGLGLQGSWWTLATFQWARFVLSFIRLKSAKSILADDPPHMQAELQKALAE